MSSPDLRSWLVRRPFRRLPAAGQATPLGLIVNELVTNSLKHAFRDDQEGTIDVVLARNSRSLVVRDNGVGCPNVKPGTGSRWTRLLAQQLGAPIGSRTVSAAPELQ